MLIRSQDRTKLVDISGKTIAVSETSIKIVYANSYIRLGMYDNKEKSFKVLDMIEEMYKNLKSDSGHVVFNMPQNEDIK